MRNLFISILSGCLLSFSCGGEIPVEKAPPDFGDGSFGSGKKSNYAIVETYFGTDRNALNASSDLEFGIDRAELKYGKCEVSIPHKHEVGNIERPSIWKLEFVEDPTKHVVVLSKEILDPKQLFNSIEEEFKHKAFLFVHGYNVSFEEAAHRTAQMAYDLEFQGIPFFYSWPSQGKTKSYVHDSQNIEYSVPHIEEFIERVMTDLPCHELFIIAHSMGNRGLTKAMVNIYEKEPYYIDRIKEVILTAPDIDAQIFKRDIAPKLVSEDRSITLYASSADLALKASKAVNGYQRAGDTGDDIVVIDGIETIDASNLKTEFMGHSYFGEAKSVIDDIEVIIELGLNANDRKGLIKVDSRDGAYWKFDDPSVLD